MKRTRCKWWFLPGLSCRSLACEWLEARKWAQKCCRGRFPSAVACLGKRSVPRSPDSRPDGPPLSGWAQELFPSNSSLFLTLWKKKYMKYNFCVHELVGFNRSFKSSLTNTLLYSSLRIIIRKLKLSYLMHFVRWLNDSEICIAWWCLQSFWAQFTCSLSH